MLSEMVVVGNRCNQRSNCTVASAWRYARMCLHSSWYVYTTVRVSSPLASCQIRKIVGCACAGNAGNVSPPPRVSDPDMHHGTCVTYVLWCMPGWLTIGFLWNWWWGKRSRYSWRMRNPQFYLSGKRIISECSRSELAMMDGMWCYSSGTTPFLVSHGKSWSNGWHTSPISII